MDDKNIDLVLNKNDDLEDEIDLNFLISILLRNKKFIILVTLITTLIGGFISSVKKNVWEGGFNILIKENQGFKSESRESLLKLSSGLSPFLQMNQNDSDTQKLILRSPSVLMPVYAYDQEYTKKNKSNYSKISFNKWRNKLLKINFEDDSSVLSVRYKSQNKEHIINILNLISSTYQDYSTKERTKNINNAIRYLEKQTSLMSEKSLSSQKNFNQFSIENGLGNIDGFIGLGESRNPLLISDNKDKYNLDPKSKGLDNTTNNAGQRYNMQFKLLEEYEAEYIDLSSKLKPNSKLLTRTKNKIDNLKSSLKRPNEKLVKYNELKIQAERDQYILSQLQEQLEMAKLEKIKTSEPWVLISKPNLFEIPVGPRKLRYTLLSFIIAFVLSSLTSIINEKLKGKIYEIETLKKNIPYKLIETIYTNDSILISNIIMKTLNIKNSDKLAIINLSNEFFKDDFEKNIQLSKDNLSFEFINFYNIEKLKNFKNILLIAQKGKINHKNLKLIKNYLTIFKEKIDGWLIIDS